MEKSVIILGKLSSSLNRRDEVPNQELAKEILQTADREAVQILVENLKNKNNKIQNDCIKTLYEVGAVTPELIADYLTDFLALLNNKNNRLQWGGMIALNYIANVKPKEIYAYLPQILDAADKGSIITKDAAVNILIILAHVPEYSENAFSLFIEQLLKSPTNQLPMYAERALPIINEQNKKVFTETLQSRLPDIEKESKRKRVEKIIKKLASFN